ncbi:response regulator [Alkalilimnicola ehrlichii]|uniref:sigma-54-dependent transcriptional regulator n=1 Tax=Alkalilimnicola ehrlichii TaxID=351052 RepID=UPI000E2F959A|nr:sigma-54 dependent transcriptional regulator [Alkalilimnicola ehrlichii]RFA27734.1 response regulator [Alkalilimnicola ehrlichii]
MGRILIIEDESIIRRSLKRLLERNGYEVADTASVEDAEAAHDLNDFDLILSDLRLPGAEGTDVMQRAPEVPVIIMTSYASVRSAVDAMKQGAVDYVAKPFDHDEMLLTIKRALAEDRLQRRSAALKADVERDYPVAGMIGHCEAMRRVFDWVHKVAPTDTTVLILGESGTGKELVARAVHEHSRRSEAPLVAVNCAAIPDTLIEAELFGHEKGAFTGAVGTRQGLVEAADGGTLFLDEIGELPLTAQARLLRVLQEGEIRRVGSANARKVDIRLVAATHRDLEKMVEQQQFREDLYFRIHVMEIRLPPLRERGEDIESLAQFLLDKACRRQHRPPMQFHTDTLAVLRQYEWPGNVRELGNVIERAVILAESQLVTTELLGLPQTTHSEADSHLDLSLEDYFREFVLTNQDQMTETELAKKLGISRKALWEKRQRLNIPRARHA